MAQVLDRLTALQVTKLSKPGDFCDGGGLYLRIVGAGRSWVFKFSLNGRCREMGLGSVKTFSLKEARAAALRCRQLCHAGIDPIEQRKAERAGAALQSARSITFEAATRAYLKAHGPKWKSARWGLNWQNSLEAYAFPIFGRLLVSAIDTALVKRCLDPIWLTKTETALRVRARVEAILGWSQTMGYRQGDNPARWDRHLENLLPKPSAIHKPKRMASLPYEELPDLMAKARAIDTMPSFALQLLILTASRTSDVIGARWDEVALQEKSWTIPAARYKTDREHRIALSTPAITLLQRLHETKIGDLVFPSPTFSYYRPMPADVMLRFLRELGFSCVVHGFRSTFRVWAAERTNFPGMLAEMAMGHQVGSEVERAYMRSDLFQKRLRLMESWGTFCTTPKPTGEVVAMPRRIF